MTWLHAVAREVFGLFVDDGKFALAILLWVVLVALGLSYLAPHSPWAGLLLFAGLALILLQSVLRFANSRH